MCDFSEKPIKAFFHAIHYSNIREYCFWNTLLGKIEDILQEAKNIMKQINRTLNHASFKDDAICMGWFKGKPLLYISSFGKTKP